MLQRPQEKLSVGIIGAGNIVTHRHIPAFKRDPRVRIVGIAARHWAPEVAQKFHIPRAFSKVEDLLQLKPDIVSICTPPRTHAELAIASMEHGCHVLVEKPMGMNSQEAALMMETANKHGLKLSVVHNFLFANCTRKAIRIIEAGEIGNLVTVLGIQFNNPRRQRRGLPTWCQELPGGLFFDETPQMAYLFRQFLGPPLQVVDAKIQEALPGSLNPISAGEVSFRGQKAMGHLIVAYESALSEWLLTVVGTKHILVLDIFRDTLVKLPPDNEHGTTQILATSLRAIRQHIQGVLVSAIRYRLNRLSWGHEKLIRQFIDSIITEAPVPVPATEGAEIVEVLEDILRLTGLPQNHSRDKGQERL